MKKQYYTKRELVAKANKYGFNQEYILQDNRVRLSFTNDFLDNLKSAVIDYTSWQLMVIQNYNHIYGDKVCKGICENLEKQFNALHKFEEDWREADYYERHKDINATE